MSINLKNKETSLLIRKVLKENDITTVDAVIMLMKLVDANFRYFLETDQGKLYRDFLTRQSDETIKQYEVGLYLVEKFYDEMESYQKSV